MSWEPSLPPPHHQLKAKKHKLVYLVYAGQQNMYNYRARCVGMLAADAFNIKNKCIPVDWACHDGSSANVYNFLRLASLRF